MYLLQKTAVKCDQNTLGDTVRGANHPASFSVVAEVFKFQHVKQQAGEPLRGVKRALWPLTCAAPFGADFLCLGRCLRTIVLRSWHSST